MDEDAASDTEGTSKAVHKVDDGVGACATTHQPLRHCPEACKAQHKYTQTKHSPDPRETDSKPTVHLTQFTVLVEGGNGVGES